MWAVSGGSCGARGGRALRAFAAVWLALTRALRLCCFTALGQGGASPAQLGSS